MELYKRRRASRGKIEKGVAMAGKTEKQVALIVGASRGIGRQIAIDLAANGYAGMNTLLTPQDFARG